VSEETEQQWLDRQYSPSSCIAAIEPELERYRSASADARRAMPPELVAYGAGPHETIDLWRPHPGAPVLAFFHGGFWHLLSKGDVSFPAPPLAAAGFGYASIDYPLAPGAALGEIVERARAAVAYLVEHLAPSPLVVGGHSAGAHLAACALDVPGVAGGLLVSGVYDLRPVARSYVAGEIGGLDQLEAERLSPLLHISRVDEPVLVVVGEIETSEFTRQTTAYAEAWEAAGNPPPRVVVAHGRNHFDVLYDIADHATHLGRAVGTLLGG
jgi:arylformamidase